MKALMNVRKRVCFNLLLCVCLFIAGCAPQEKTLLLETGAGDETGEVVEAAEDFTVKKIYTYTYDTNAALDRSASIKGCQEHEIRVIAEGGQGSGGLPEGRLVDYRYGFYDLTGQGGNPREEQTGSGMTEFWSIWPNDDWGGEAALEEIGAYYVERLQLSPDGRQMLVYARALVYTGKTYSENRCVWLYDFETQEPWLLYQGTANDWADPRGAFSSDGRWVTFDVTASKTGMHVVVYDCQKEHEADIADTEWVTLDGLARIYPPEQLLVLNKHEYTEIWAAEIFDISGTPGVLGVVEEKQFSPEVFQSYNLGDSDGMGYSMSQYYMYGDLSVTMPNLRYELDAEEDCVYYLEDFQRLWSIDMVEGTTAGFIEFEDTILDFLRLDSGEILALTTQEMPENYAIRAEGYVNSLAEIQRFGDIRSVDLYLYSADGTGGQLLYKNLQNVISMEYDVETRRILVETYEDPDQMSRKCIILEL